MTAHAIADVLGGAKLLGTRLSSPSEQMDALRTGLPASSLDELADSLSISRAELARALRIPQRTLTRRVSKSSRLTPDESERVLAFAKVVAAGREVLGGFDHTSEWLRRPVLALANKRPLDSVDTVVGAQEVEALLWRVAYGVYS